jgi:hypothetical protein
MLSVASYSGAASPHLQVYSMPSVFGIMRPLRRHIRPHHSELCPFAVLCHHWIQPSIGLELCGDRSETCPRLSSPSTTVVRGVQRRQDCSPQLDCLRRIGPPTSPACRIGKSRSNPADGNPARGDIEILSMSGELDTTAEWDKSCSARQVVTDDLVYRRRRQPSGLQWRGGGSHFVRRTRVRQQKKTILYSHVSSFIEPLLNW